MATTARSKLGRSLLSVGKGVQEWIELNRSRAAPEEIEAVDRTEAIVRRQSGIA
jgi:hypothetical protein